MIVLGAGEVCEAVGISAAGYQQAAGHCQQPGHRNVLRPQGSTLEARVHLSRSARYGRHLSSSMDGEVVFGCYGVRAFGCGVAHASATLPDVHGGTVTMGFNFGV